MKEERKLRDIFPTDLPVITATSRIIKKIFSRCIQRCAMCEVSPCLAFYKILIYSISVSLNLVSRLFYSVSTLHNRSNLKKYFFYVLSSR